MAGDQTKHLMYVVTSLEMGGAQQQVVHLAAKFQRRGWRVSVVSLMEPSFYKDAVEQASDALYSLGMVKGFGSPVALFRFISIVRQTKPDVVHSHLFHANLLARLARPFVRAPVLFSTSHSMNEGANRRYRIYRLTDALADLSTNVSEAAVTASFERGAAPEHKLRFVPNGLEPETFELAHLRDEKRRALGLGNAFTWFAAGRLVEVKDYPLMLRAFAKALEHKPEQILLLAGGGPLASEIEMQAQTLKIGERVRLLGLRDDIPELMNASDAYLMSSVWEGLPMVLLEASASALPMVATDVGGNREVIQEGTTGYLVPAGQPEALAKQMITLLEKTPQERRAMGEAARRFVKARYSLEAVADQWETLYLEYLGRERHSTMRELSS